jgi:hypothetical protein
MDGLAHTLASMASSSVASPAVPAMTLPTVAAAPASTVKTADCSVFCRDFTPVAMVPTPTPVVPNPAAHPNFSRKNAIGDNLHREERVVSCESFRVFRSVFDQFRGEAVF